MLTIILLQGLKMEPLRKKKNRERVWLFRSGEGHLLGNGGIKPFSLNYQHFTSLQDSSRTIHISRVGIVGLKIYLW